MKSQLACQSDKILVGFERVDGVASRVQKTEFQLKPVLPFQPLAVVIVGFDRHIAPQRIAALASFIPVSRHIVLHELQCEIALEAPEVRFLHHESDTSGQMRPAARRGMMGEVGVASQRLVHDIVVVVAATDGRRNAVDKFGMGNIEFHQQRVGHGIMLFAG